MSITNAQRQRVRSLQQRKWRRKYNAFVVEGLVNVNEVLSSSLTVEELFYTPEVNDQLQGLDSLNPGQFYAVGQRELERLSSQRTPHGVLAVVTIPDYSLSGLPSMQRIVYLDGVADPGNVGTLVRSAEWFGADAIVAGPGTADWYNPKTVAATRGSLFRLPHYNAEPQVLTKVAETHELYVADLGGTPMHEVVWAEQAVLVIGSESHGPTGPVLQLSPKPVTIPRATNARAESLNAGVAGSILLAAWAS